MLSVIHILMSGIAVLTWLVCSWSGSSSTPCSTHDTMRHSLWRKEAEMAAQYTHLPPNSGAGQKVVPSKKQRLGHVGTREN